MTTYLHVIRTGVAVDDVYETTAEHAIEVLDQHARGLVDTYQITGRRRGAHTIVMRGSYRRQDVSAIVTETVPA